MSRTRRICWILGVTLVIATGSYSVLTFPARADPFQRALQFWVATYPDDPPQCSPSDLKFYENKDAPQPEKGMTSYAWVADGSYHSCEIHVNYLLLFKPFEFQCVTLLHEMGHSWYSFSHSSLNTNVMFWDISLIPIPGVCYASRKLQASHEASRRRSHPRSCARGQTSVRCLRPDPYGHPHREDHTATGHRAQ